jgi:Leucine-rich repeat (LRR) protein
MTRTRAGVLALLLAATTQPLANAESIPEILNILFDATNGDNWHDYDGWYSPNPFSFCDWSGITCYDVDRDDERYGHIETLDLSANRLEGDLPVEIWDIPYLHNLVLRENPDLVINFDGIEYAEHLHRLVLSNTYIDSFEYLSSESLNELHLTDCSLNGVFPYEVTQLVNLEALYANFNRLNGNIPDEIGDMENLVELYLYDNYFEGPIPDTIGNLQYLEALVLSNNDLTGELPADQLNKLVSLRVITLSGNWFKGEIPSLDNLSELRELFLFDNDFTGQIPKAFLWSAPKDELITVDLRNNHLTG